MKGLRVILSRVLRHLQVAIDGAFREGWLCGEAGSDLPPGRGVSGASLGIEPAVLDRIPVRYLQKAPFSPGMFGRATNMPPVDTRGPNEWRKANPLFGRPFDLIGIDWSADYAAPSDETGEAA